MGAEMEIILTYLLLALATVLIISVIVLAIYVERLRNSVTLMRGAPVTLVKRRPINPEEKDKPIVRRPRPVSGTCSWKSGSMESVFYVPSRTGSPEVFRKSDNDDVELACTATTGAATQFQTESWCRGPLSPETDERQKQQLIRNSCF